MAQTLTKRYENRKPVGSAYISGTFGLLVYEPYDGDEFDCDYICSWCDGNRTYGFHKHNVHYGSSGRPFFRKGNLRIYLDNVMRLK